VVTETTAGLVIRIHLEILLQENRYYSNQSDGWFMGMVLICVTGVWVGCEDRSACFKSITYGQGATAALPVCYFMKLCYADPALKVSKEGFERPANLSIKVDCYVPKK
jgi:penicillin-binding protein 1A